MFSKHVPHLNFEHRQSGSKGHEHSCPELPLCCQKSLSGIRTIVEETANYTSALSGEEKKSGSKRKELGARSTGFYCPLIKIDD